MKKIAVPISNHFCPQALFAYGTYRSDGKANFGLFCWFTYCWDDGLGVMACIGEPKLTRDRVRETGMFSANLINRPLLPLADYFGGKSGYDEDKMDVAVHVAPGRTLAVPLLADSPWSYELAVTKTIPLGGGGEAYICRIAGVTADEALSDESADVRERLLLADPVSTTHYTYFSLNGERLGAWGDWKDKR